jgi:hypothetical protein
MTATVSSISAPAADQLPQGAASAGQQPVAGATTIGTGGGTHKIEATGPFHKLGQTLGLTAASTSGADDCLPYEQLLRMREKIRGAQDATEEISDELSAAVGLAERIRIQNLFVPGAGDQLEFIVDCLLMPKPLLTVARDGRVRLQLEIYRRAGRLSRLLAGISAGSSAGLVLAALFLSLILWTLLVTGVRWLTDNNSFAVSKDIFFMNGRALLVITSAAFIGGVVSIATRLREFSRVRDLDPFAMFWTALLKPLIGVILSLFILATLAGGVISFGILDKNAFEAIDEETAKALQAKLVASGASAKDITTAVIDNIIVGTKALYVLWVFGFLAGFSERFAWDFVDRAQGVTSATKDKKE